MDPARQASGILSGPPRLGPLVAHALRGADDRHAPKITAARDSVLRKGRRGHGGKTSLSTAAGDGLPGHERGGSAGRVLRDFGQRCCRGPGRDGRRRGRHRSRAVAGVRSPPRRAAMRQAGQGRAMPASDAPGGHANPAGLHSTTARRVRRSPIPHEVADSARSGRRRDRTGSPAIARASRSGRTSAGHGGSACLFYESISTRTKGVKCDVRTFDHRRR